VHGSWTDAFVSGAHRYLMPKSDDGSARGLCGRDWPTAAEVGYEDLADRAVDLVVLQRPEELELTARWLRRRPGVDVPAVYVEHNAPRPYAVDSPHPLGDQSDIPVVHVTDFNRLMWDNGRAQTRVIDHGIPDRGHLYTGEIDSAATMINEPLRRWRTVGTDLLGALSRHVPVDVWGIGTDDLNDDDHRVRGVTGRGDVPTARLLAEVARRRVYVHTARWTSLGLSLLEAMTMGMPVVAVASTMAPLAVPRETGVVSADPDVLGRAAAHFVADREAAALAGKAARDFALTNFGLGRFLSDWDRLIEEVCS
jgi:glycosyltransferase involved in cell wall biosynthesis